jgi:PAS domain S-box-containing protein
MDKRLVFRRFGVLCDSAKSDQVFSKTTRCESLLEAVSDALAGMDQKGVIRFISSWTKSLLGYNRDDLVGQPIEALVPGPPGQIYATRREDCFAGVRTRSVVLDLELSGRHWDRTEFPASISVSHIDTGDGLLDHGGA